MRNIFICLVALTAVALASIGLMGMSNAVSDGNGGYQVMDSGGRRAIFTWDVPSMLGGVCTTKTVTVSSALNTAECLVGMPILTGTNPGNVQFTCATTADATVVINACCIGTLVCDPSSATYSVRVFNPTADGGSP